MTAPLTKATDIFVVANDARFLFKKLRRSPEVEQVANNTTDNLLQWLADHARDQPGTVEELVSVYVHLVALHLKDEDAAANLTASQIPKVQWSEKFLDLMKKARTQTTRAIIDPCAFVTPRQLPAIVGSDNSTHKALIIPGY